MELPVEERPQPEWPLLLRVEFGTAAHWGTGFLVQKQLKPKEETTIVDEELPTEEFERLLKKKIQERSELDEDIRQEQKDPLGAKEVAATKQKKKQEAERDFDNKLQNTGIWRLGYVPEKTTATQYFLVTNQHVLQKEKAKFTRIAIYFRPRHGQQFNIVTLTRPDNFDNWYREYQDDPNFQDVAVLPLHMLDCRNELKQIKTTAPRPLVGMEAFAAGFPLLSVTEHGNWNYKDPVVYKGNVCVVIPSLEQIRVQMPLLWGASGSLVYGYVLKTASFFDPVETWHVALLGVFSHIQFATNQDKQWDSGIRRVWEWSVVENILHKREDEEICLIVPTGN